jgi:hypothetical protein
MSDEEAQETQSRGGRPLKTWLFAAVLFVFGIRLLSSKPR